MDGRCWVLMKMRVGVGPWVVESVVGWVGRWVGGVSRIGSGPKRLRAETTRYRKGR